MQWWRRCRVSSEVVGATATGATVAGSKGVDVAATSNEMVAADWTCAEEAEGAGCRAFAAGSETAIDSAEGGHAAMYEAGR